MKVFLSYSRRDAEFVDRLDHRLTALGYDVWTDRADIGESQEDRWRRTVVKAIRESDVVVLVLSPNSTTSPSVERELTVAADNSKRVIPLLESPCELPDGFQYDLAGIQYVDFVAYGFDVGVHRLATQLGPTDPGRPAVDEAEQTDTRDTDPSDQLDSADSHDDGWGRRTALLVSGLAVVVALAAVAFALSRDDDQDSGGFAPDRSSFAQTSTGPTVASSTADSVAADSTQPAPPAEHVEAEALVAAWADATTRRDFDEVARIDPTASAEHLEFLYHPADDPVRMISVQPYIVEVTPDGSNWRVRGAAMGWDYNPEPTVRTHVMCSEWLVDLAAGTATWTTDADKFLEGEQLTEEDYPAAYDAYCT